MSVQKLAGSGLVPFRLVLQDCARLLDGRSGWGVVEACLAQTYGPASPALAACRQVQREALLVLDGFDEAHAHRARLLEWIAGFDNTVHIIVTSRPAAVYGVQNTFGQLGFAAHTVLPLTDGEMLELAEKFAESNGLESKPAKAVASEICTVKYRHLAQVPVTLNLLLHVLTKQGIGAVLSRSELYGHSVAMLVQNDQYRHRVQTGVTEVAWSLGTLRRVAFWNHICGVRSQPWSAFASLGPELAALRAHVEHGLLPVLEVVRGQLQFAHLSFQEYLAAEFLTGVLEVPARTQGSPRNGKGIPFSGSLCRWEWKSDFPENGTEQGHRERRMGGQRVGA